MSTSHSDDTRTQYLNALLTSYGTLHLPINSDQHYLPLQTIFQPLTLRHGPFSFEKAEHEMQKTASPQEDKAGSSAITAHNGAEALAKSTLRRMVVLGGPGMGKTTLLKDLLRQAIHHAQTNHSAPIPIFISLPDLARSELTIQAYLPGILTELGIDTSYAHFLAEAVNEGQAFLCLDSLDEVAPAQRPDMIALINRAAVRCGGTWIIGSRFTEYKGGQFVHSQFAEWELQPLDQATCLELARHLLPVLSDLLHKTPTPSAEDFVKRLHQDTRIAAWGENPLLFSLAAIVYVQAGMLPACRAALYRDIITIMLTARTPDQYEREELRILLANVALQLYQTRGRNFMVSELLALLTIHYPDASFQAHTAMVARILDSGLLDVVAYQTYGFKHQMFQEYLAAVALARKLSSQDETERSAGWEFAWRKRTYSRWNEILRLCVGVLVQENGEEGSQVAAQWLRKLADERSTPDGDVGDLGLELALGSLREFSSALYTTELADVTRVLILIWVEMLVKLLQKQKAFAHLSKERLGRLIEDVKMLDLHLVLPAITWAEGVRDHGYQGLNANDAARNSRTILQDLAVTVPAKVLASAFPDAQGISLYASTLPGTLQAYGSMEQLVQQLLDREEHWRIRAGAASLLGEWEARTPITVLREVLEDSTSYYQIRIAIVEALGKQDERMPIELLADLLQDQHERIRIAAITALAHAGKRAPVEPLLAALNDTEKVRKAVWVALDKLDEQVAPEPLLTALHSENEAIRAAALQLLGSRTPVEQLQAALHDTHATVRSAAVRASGKLKEQIPINLLVETLHDPDKDVYLEAKKALKVSGRTVPVEALITLAQKHRMLVRALKIAQELQIALPADLLLATLDNQLYGPSDDAARLLAYMGPHAPIAALLNMLLDTSSPARLGAAKALALLAPHVPTEPIFTLLQELDASSELYPYLVTLLLRSEAHIPVELLLNAIKTEKLIRNYSEDAIVIALGDLGEQAPIEELLHMIRDHAPAYGLKPDGRAIQVLKSTYTWITPEKLLATSHHKILDERLAIKVLAAMGKSAPIDLIKSVLDDESRDRYLRTEARRTLHKVGVNLPLKYFVAEKDLGYEGTDGYLIEAMRELGAQAPIQELLELLVSNYDWIKYLDLLQRTGDNDGWVHDTVMDALCELVPYLPLETLIATLDHSNPLARKGAAHVLGAFGERAPIHKLIALLHNPEEKRVVRAVTLRTLTSLHPYAPVEALIAVLRDEDFEIRRSALWSLEKWGRDIPLEPLLALVDDDEYDLRDDAIRALGWLQDRAPIDLLLSLLDSDNKNNAENAAQALSCLGKYASLDALIAHLYNSDGDIRIIILEALANMGEYAPLEMILQLLNNEDDKVRWHIEFALDDLAEAAPARFVMLAKNDPRSPVRKALMKAIAKLGKDAPIELALTALEDEDEDVRFYARIALLKLDVDPAIIPVELLLHALYEQRSEHDSHWSELELLAKSGTQAPLEPLLASLGNSNINICKNVAQTLYQTHPEVFVEIARQAEAILRGEPTGGVFASRVQSRIADRVTWIERATPAVLDMISDLLDWPYWEVRMKAAQALKAVHRNIPDRAIRRLMELRHDPDSQAVCKAADEALAEILSRESGMEDDIS